MIFRLHFFILYSECATTNLVKVRKKYTTVFTVYSPHPKATSDAFSQAQRTLKRRVASVRNISWVSVSQNRGLILLLDTPVRRCNGGPRACFIVCSFFSGALGIVWTGAIMKPRAGCFFASCLTFYN